MHRPKFGQAGCALHNAVLAICALFTTAATVPGAYADENPIEAGTVNWQRDLDAALEKSADTGAPVFLLFQEIPGCGGCKAFGRTVLSNPLLVEAIEDTFIPVLVYNNRKGGPDEKRCKQFSEPAWNYQVVRYLDAKGRDVLPRKDRVWDIGGTASRMIEALKAVGRPVPQYLELVAAENEAEALSGFPTEQLTSAYRKAKPSDQQKQVERWRALHRVPGLTGMQLTKMNATAAAGREQATAWLSPRQIQALNEVDQQPSHMK